MLRGQLREEGSASLKVKDRNTGLPRSIRPEVSACGRRDDSHSHGGSSALDHGVQCTVGQ